MGEAAARALHLVNAAIWTTAPVASTATDGLPASAAADVQGLSLRIAYRVGVLRVLTAVSGQRFELRLDLEEIPPRELLVGGISKQIGRVQRRHGRDRNAGSRDMRLPVAAQPHHPFRRTEQGFRGGTAERDQNLRVGELDLPLDEGAADFGFMGWRRA